MTGQKHQMDTDLLEGLIVQLKSIFWMKAKGIVTVTPGFKKYIKEEIAKQKYKVVLMDGIQ